MFQVVDAERSKVKIKLGLNGPSGSGKTMSAIKIALGIVGDISKIGLVDSENRSASLYAPMFGKFKKVELTPPFSPERYIGAINALAKTPGIELIIVDSGSHEWSGPGGCIEINETLAQAKYRGNTWSAWNETTPRHDAFINCILQTDLHFVVCNRSKTETVMGDDKKVKKMGMKEIQREGMEYEWSLSFNIDRDTHTAIASKDRTNLFERLDPFVISEDTGKKIKEWCELGIQIEPASIKSAIPAPASKPSEEPKELLTKTHAKWLEVVAAIKGTYTIDNVRIKYNIDPDALKSLEEIVEAKNKPAELAPAPVTQQMISDKVKAEITAETVNTIKKTKPF